MTYHFTVEKNPDLAEEVSPRKYDTFLTLRLVSIEDGLNQMEVGISESLRMFLGENLYNKDRTNFEWFLRATMFGRGLSEKEIEKGIKKIKNKWKRTRKEGEYEVVL